MRPRTGSISSPLRTETEADIPTICPLVGAEVLQVCCHCHAPQILYYPQLWINPVVEDCASPTSSAAFPCSQSVSVRFPTSLFLWCWPHYPLFTFFSSPPNSISDPKSTSSIAVVLEECRNTCTRLWIQSIKYAPKRGSLAKALSYCHSKRSM